ncbi:hypothetical protein HPB52_013218 [Rhipicephalus sanguineus]|uniref:Uncharacterized protein n=1 Tax=Rhipicephalus sanguineus TaxID=34632 RepID=A0A9D4SST7_RHISA|nr:hypothetical protein HPB52_013218 [Rhipicephalus sanguineus]
MHAVLLQALPVELHHLAAATTSSPRLYDDLRAAVLASYGEKYRPLPGSREFQVSPLSQRAVPASPQPPLDHDDTSLLTTPSTSVPATGASIPVPDHQDKVEDASTSSDLFNTRCTFWTASDHGPSCVPTMCMCSPPSTVHDTSDTSGSPAAISPHSPERAIDMDIVTPRQLRRHRQR